MTNSLQGPCFHFIRAGSSIAAKNDTNISVLSAAVKSLSLDKTDTISILEKLFYYLHDSLGRLLT